MIFSTPEFWILVSFILLLIALGRRVFSYLIQHLDEHSKDIALQLTEARRVHDEALSLLGFYQNKHDKAVEQVEKILLFAENESLEFKKTSEQELQHFIDQKEKEFLQRLSLEKKEVMTKLRQEAVDEALTIVEQVLSKDHRERKKITDEALMEIRNISFSKNISTKSLP